MTEYRERDVSTDNVVMRMFSERWSWAVEVTAGSDGSEASTTGPRNTIAYHRHGAWLCSGFRRRVGAVPSDVRVRAGCLERP